MDLGIFGAERGIQSWQEDWNQLMNSEVQRRQVLGEIAQQPLRAELLQTQVSAQQRALAERVRMEEVSKGVEAKNISEYVDKMGLLAGKAGMPEQAAAFAEISANMAQKEAAVSASRAAAQGHLLDQEIKKNELWGRLATWVEAQDDPAAAWPQAQILWSSQMGEMSPYAGVPYSPEMLDALKRGAISAADQMKDERQKAADENTAEYRKKRLVQMNREVAASEMRAQAAKDREARLAKGGGKRAATPTTATVDQAYYMLKEVMPDFDKSKASTEAFRIASEAEELRTANPALGSDSAIAQALQEAIKSGRYKGVGWGDVMGLPFWNRIQAEPRIAPPGGAAPGAAPAPRFPALPADQKELKRGAYSTPKGPVYYMGPGKEKPFKELRTFKSADELQDAIDEEEIGPGDPFLREDSEEVWFVK